MFGELTSLTGGGPLDASATATATGGRVGDAIVGGLTVSAAPGSNNMIILFGVLALVAAVAYIQK